MIVDRQGRLFFTNEESVLRLDRRGAQPKVLAMVSEPGGLAFDVDGSLIVGFGNTASNGSVGDQTGPSGLLRVDPDSGAQSVYATGLSMANGLDRGPDGSFYASNDFGANIDRVRGGVTERGWARVESGNGLVVDSSGRYLYVAQTFRPAAIQRVDLADPTRVTEYIRAEPADMAAGLDGMTRDARDRLLVTANGAGEVWRIDTKPSICVLLDGLPGFPDGPSAVAVGSHEGAFPAENAYVVTFDGKLIELVDVAAAEPTRPGAPARPKLRLRVRPRRTRTGRVTRFRLRVTATRQGAVRPVARARIRLAGVRAVTGSRGRARVAKLYARPGRRRVIARKAGFRSAVVRVRVIAPEG